MPNQFININFVKPNLRLNVLYTYYLSNDKKKHKLSFKLKNKFL